MGGNGGNTRALQAGRGRTDSQEVQGLGKTRALRHWEGLRDRGILGLKDVN